MSLQNPLDTELARRGGVNGLITQIKKVLTFYFPKPTGKSTDYIRGDGSIAPFPTISGSTYNPTAGTGISITGTSPNQTITNTLPDQTVVVNAGTGIGVTGTYPNFTITNTSPSSGGTVTSVTASSPLSSTGGTTPDISISQATAMTNGYLSSTDWSTFNGKQDLLVSGTNIKTINSNSILGSGNLTISASAAGNTGEIQFNNGGVFAADSNLFWDNTNKRLGIGATPSTSVRLDVRAQGALSTDIAFRVRNSANNHNLFSIQGTNRIDVGETNGLGQFLINGTSRASTDLVFRVIGVGSQQLFAAQQNGVVRMGANANSIQFDGTNWRIFNSGNTNWNIDANKYFLIGQNAGIGTFTIGTLTVVPKSTSASEYVFCLTGGTTQTYFQRVSNTNVTDIFNSPAAPSTNVADAFRMYASDIVAGNSAPHFRTENGSVIKLYQETTAIGSSAFVQNTGNAVNDASTFDGYTIAQIVKALRTQGLLA